MRMTRINEWLRIGTKIAITFVMIFSVWTTVAYALDDYTVLAPLPGTTKCGNNLGPDCKTDFKTYLPGLFKWAISIAAVMAFIMITAGGITYMTSDSVFKTEKGRGMIENAIWGLVLVIGAYVILYTINPAILSFTLDITAVNPKENKSGIVGGTGTVTNGTPMTQDQITAHNAVLAELDPIKPYAPACLQGQTRGCVNLNGLKPATIVGLKNLRKECLCGITITGGTEGGHTAGSSHNDGTAVDIRPTPALNSYLQSTSPENPNILNPPPGTKVVVVIGSVQYTYEHPGDNGIATGEHWHVEF